MPDGWGGMDDDLIKQNEIPYCDEEDQFEKQKETIWQGERRFTQTSFEQSDTVDFLGQDSGKYNFHVKYTPPPLIFKNETIVSNGWGGIDEVPINKLSLEGKENQDEKMTEKIRRGDRRFICKARRRGKIIDYLS